MEPFAGDDVACVPLFHFGRPGAGMRRLGPRLSASEARVEERQDFERGGIGADVIDQADLQAF